jgi:hypothetical protein
MSEETNTPVTPAPEEKKLSAFETMAQVHKAAINPAEVAKDAVSKFLKTESDRKVDEAAKFIAAGFEKLSKIKSKLSKLQSPRLVGYNADRSPKLEYTIPHMKELTALEEYHKKGSHNIFCS